jgi:hypothetical protein
MAVRKNLEEPVYTHKKQQNLDMTIGKELERASIQNQTEGHIIANITNE